ncbi:MAG: hypothetical protein LBS20_09160 [Prevotella sp.]|jgi:hypothetical protein|nr:hypothetical protein [Prevotella sp.]
MKTKFKYVTLVAIALLLGFSSCSSNDETTVIDEGNPKTVSLKIGNGGPTPKSEGGALADGASITFTSGDLYFVNESGTILKHYTLSSDPASDTNINLDDVQAGTVISNLPGSVVAVHVAGNTADLPTSGNISAIQAATLEVATQVDIESVNLYGSGSLSDPLEEGDPYICNLTLSPTVARIELGDITGGGAVTSFKVEGIFIDNYYSEAGAGGIVDAENLADNGSDGDAFNDNTGAYPEALKPAIYDFYTGGLASASNVVSPATPGDVWAYNLFAASTGSAVPRIVIRLTDIETNDGSTIISPQFITIKGFKSAGTSLTGIQAGKVYHIAAGSFEFDEEDLTPEPNLDPIDVDVTITLATWTVVPVETEL